MIRFVEQSDGRLVAYAAGVAGEHFETQRLVGRVEPDGHGRFFVQRRLVSAAGDWHPAFDPHWQPVASLEEAATFLLDGAAASA